MKQSSNNFYVTTMVVICLGLGSLIACSKDQASEKELSKYNVLMIIVDDQNAGLNSLHDSVVHTPNMKRLAAKSLVFSRAYCAAPACGPSRTALLTGIHPATSGVYYNNQNFREAPGWLRKVVDLPLHFKNNGYLTANFGKVFHQSFQDDNRENFSNGYFFPFSAQKDLQLKEEAVEVTRLKHPMWYYGPLPDAYDREDTTKMQQDTRNANRAIQLLQQSHDKPFFCALGLWKPHGPWYVPQRYFDKYPVENITLPKGYLEDDLNDVPACAAWLATYRGYHDEITERNLWKKTLQAYYASITYADEQLGRVLDALEESQYAENTIIIFIGDNGFHTGEKNHWSKFALWDSATRVPMMISFPENFDLAGKTSKVPVSLLDIYPTLTQLCQLPSPESHEPEGVSLVPLLNNLDKYIKPPIVSTYGWNCHAVVGKTYYYIRYRNGAEELYNSATDMNQWNNLANNPEYRFIMDSLSHFLPEVNAEDIVYANGAKAGSHSWSSEAFH